MNIKLLHKNGKVETTDIFMHRNHEVIRIPIKVSESSTWEAKEFMLQEEQDGIPIYKEQ